MDRLTFDGNFCDIAMCREMPCKYPDTGCSQKQVWERLKAYEETGLAPEDIKIIRQLYDWWLYDGMTKASFIRLRELAQADKDGRCIALPCKEGDTVYEIDLPEYGVIVCRVVGVTIYNGPMFHVAGNEIVRDVSILCEVIEGHYNGPLVKTTLEEIIVNTF